MSENHQGYDCITAQSSTHRSLTRRGLIAGAAALATGLVATQATQPVAAGVDGDVVLGASNSTTGITRITNTATTNGTIALALTAENGANGIALLAVSSGIAVSASSSGTTGITGGSSSETGIGVDGIAQNNAGGTGVRGRSFSSTGIGVQGTSTGGTGVQGVIPTPSSVANTVAVQGLNQSTGTGGIGVSGRSDGTTGIGVQGQSTKGVGVFGTSNGNAGVLGISNAPGNAGLAGIANVAGTAAFAGTSTNPNAFAGFFTGDVFVNGNFTVNDPTRKHGAIQHPDGSHRILYSLESPEPWLEDFGEGKLVNGKAEVKLDVDFAAVMHTEQYHVFLTEYGETNGLYVSARSANGFAVQERKGGVASGTFGWRVVVRPKSEHAAERLAKFVIPQITVRQPPA